LDIGADDYLAKTCDIEVLKARVRSAGRIIHLTAELEAKNLTLQETNAQLDKAYSYIKRDLELAAKAQVGLLPPQDLVIAGVRFNWLFLPADFIAGDTLNYFRRSEHQIVFYQLDVAGHGVASALHSFSLTRILSPDTHAAELCKPTDESVPADTPCSAAEIVTDLNRRFQSGVDLLTYFTMAYGVIDLRERSIDLCLAGHQKPIHVPKDRKPELVGQNGFPVGIFPDADYASNRVGFGQGDRLFVYSDGISECMNADGEEFGIERLLALLDEARSVALCSVGKVVMDRLEAWKGDNQFEDDISLLALEITDI
jgi:sigma-B regulation protein RsbU (phosphoserine phosphatase)